MNQPIQYLTAVTKAGDKNKVFLESCGDFYPAVLINYDLIRNEVSCMNSKLTDYLGFSVSEFENFSAGLSELAIEEDVPLIRSAISTFYSLSERESYIFTGRFRHKSGGCKYMKCTCTRHRPDAIMIIAEDVTDQVKFEEEATATRQLFDETEKLLLFGTWSWIPSSNKISWTEGMYDLLGYKQEEIQELSQDFYLKHILPEHLDPFQKVVEEALHEGKGFEHEYVVKTRTGEEKYVFTKGRTIVNKDGILKKLIGITSDITAKKNFEKERERNIRELNRSNKELEEFAYVASHDLHEPLRKILTFSERLKGRFTEALGEDGKVYLERIWASADNMRRLIHNLLEFSKISRGTRAFATCNLDEILQEVISDQELRIEETSTILRRKELPTVEAVSSEMRQLFNNLISNALKFRKRDTRPVISISCKKLTHKEKSDLLLPFNETFYLINVQDNGIGFESMYSEKIFEIFQRLHGKAEYSGTGIGLAICKKIVDNHDGIINASSSPGVGSTFSVILPEKQFK